ncbi:MAG: type II toxin-antitoxin system PemK/MazF family toxin [Methylobacter sp.]
MRHPARGDIWLVDLNPTKGKELQGFRPVFIISSQEFNRFGLCVVCPITQGGQQSRYAGFAVSLMGTGTETQGVVMCNQPRTIDIHNRAGRFVEQAPDSLIEEVIARFAVISE